MASKKEMSKCKECDYKKDCEYDHCTGDCKSIKECEKNDYGWISPCEEYL